MHFGSNIITCLINNCKICNIIHHTVGIMYDTCNKTNTLYSYINIVHRRFNLVTEINITDSNKIYIHKFIIFNCLITCYIMNSK
jgi:hypothetical protein